MKAVMRGNFISGHELSSYFAIYLKSKLELEMMCWLERIFKKRWMNVAQVLGGIGPT